MGIRMRIEAKGSKETSIQYILLLVLCTALGLVLLVQLIQRCCVESVVAEKKDLLDARDRTAFAGTTVAEKRASVPLLQHRLNSRHTP